MNIVDWNEELPAIPYADEDDAQKIFMRLLSGDISVKWQGLVKRKVSTLVDLHAPYLELRKSMRGTSVLIRVGYVKKWNANFKLRQPTVGKIISAMSMNGTANFEPNDFAELHLAVKEAEGVINYLYQDK